MKINKILFVATIFIVMSSNAQITKGNWMMGGGASFGSFKSTSGEINSQSTAFSVHPTIGYFPIDKLAIGTSGELAISNTTETNYGIAPFIRYYFLGNDKQINIFSEANYGIYKINHSDYKYDKLNLKAGAVFFLNSSVGLEVALNYSNQKTNQNYQNKGIYLGVGFQIHLEKK